MVTHFGNFMANMKRYKLSRSRMKKIDEESNGAMNGVDDIDDVYVDQSV